MTSTVVHQLSPMPVLFLGQGRVSRHLHFYFNEILKVPCASLSWREVLSKKSPETNSGELRNYSFVFLVGRDKDLPVQNQWLNAADYNGRRIHCSARVHLEGVSAWHPLVSFSHDLFSQDFYLKIPFVGDEYSVSLKDSFLKLPNTEIKILKEEREKYHALCVFASNLSAALMAHSQEKFESNFRISKELIAPLFQSTALNIQKQGWAGVTGPMVRGDDESMQKNIKNLESPEEKLIYQTISEMVHNHFQYRKPLIEKTELANANTGI